METFFGSVLAFLFGIGSGSVLGLLSTVLPSEAIGQNVFCAILPFALLHTAFFNTALATAARMRIEVDGLCWRKLEKMLPRFLVTSFNILRHAQPLTVIGGVIMSLGFFASRQSENERLSLDWWGVVIAITSELKIPKTIIITIIIGVALMDFRIISHICIFLVSLPIITIGLGYIIVKNVAVSGLCGVIAVSAALIVFIRPRAVMCFSPNTMLQHLILMKAVLRSVCVFGAIVILTINIAQVVIVLVFLFPYLLLEDVAVTLLILALSLATAVTVVCRQTAVGPTAFIFPVLCIYDVKSVRSQLSLFIIVVSVLVSFLVAKSNFESVELTLQANSVINVLILSLEMVAICQIVSTLAVIFGIAVSMGAQNSQGGLILAWAGIGASLAAALAVRMVNGQPLLLKGLAASMLISLCFCVISKITMQWVNMPNMRNNIPETVKQLGSMHVASLVIGLGVALPAWIGWTCFAIGVFLPIKTLRISPVPLQEVQEDTDEEVEEEEDEAYEDDSTEDD